MSRVRDLLGRKTHGRPTIVTVATSASVLDAVGLMVEHRIGGVAVVDAAGDVAGMFTERDLLRRVVAEGRDPAGTPVDAVMTSPVVTSSPDTPMEECAALMTARRLRHLPIVDDGRLVGMITIGDILAEQVDEQRVTIAELNRYVFDLR